MKASNTRFLNPFRRGYTRHSSVAGALQFVIRSLRPTSIEPEWVSYGRVEGASKSRSTVREDGDLLAPFDWISATCSVPFGRGVTTEKPQE